MASLQEKKRKSGTAFLIQFMLNRERRSLFLDVKYSREDAEEIKRVVEKCVDAIETDNPLDRRTLAWLENVNDDLQARLVACGLVKSNESGDGMTIADLFDSYLADVARKRKKRTLEYYEFVRDVVFRLCDCKTLIADFQKADALELVARLENSHYARTTLHVMSAVIKAAFNWAVDREIIPKNPFTRMPGGGTRNKSREFYVDWELFQKMLTGCRNAKERAFLTLYRVGGLRSCEAPLVTWNDVDFENDRLVVHSPKTERITGKDTRTIPLFPELRAELDALLLECAPVEPDKSVVGPENKTSRWIIVREILKRANVPLYPRLIQNLRSSASIDIYRKYGEIAENAWLGHTLTIAKDHYLHPIDDDYNKAVEDGIAL